MQVCYIRGKSNYNTKDTQNIENVAFVLFWNVTFASSVVRMKQEPITTRTVEATDVVVTEMITDKIFIVSVSAFIYICRKKKGKWANSGNWNECALFWLLQTLTKRTKVSLKARVAFLIGKVWTERHTEHVPRGRDDINQQEHVLCLSSLFHKTRPALRSLSIPAWANRFIFKMNAVLLNFIFIKESWKKLIIM